MVKEINFVNNEDFQSNVLFYKARKKFKNPYLWEMIDLNFSEEHLMISSRFNYPNADLFEYQEEL